MRGTAARARASGITASPDMQTVKREMAMKIGQEGVSWGGDQLHYLPTDLQTLLIGREG